LCRIQRHSVFPMSRSASAVLRPPHRRPSKPHIVGRVRSTDLRPAYGLPFWMAFTSNMLVVVALSLLFRYADFVELLGGTEYDLGWIVGIGMVGSLAMRLVMGSCIDRYGTRLVWLVSILALSMACAGHLAVTSASSVAIYGLRILFSSAVAGIYGASMTFISNRTPAERMAELYGMLGTSSFAGIVVGCFLGDFLLSAATLEQTQSRWMFVAAALLVLGAYPFAWVATRVEARPKSTDTASTWAVLRRYSPRAVLVVCIAMAVPLTIPGIFLRPYAAQLGVPRIGTFFLAYAVAATAIRIISRRWFERFGNRRMALAGFAIMAASMATFPLAHNEWLLLVPAVGCGCSQAILFPSVAAACTVAFPSRHRGLATLLMLALNDVGQLVGAPAAGAVLRYSAAMGLPSYPTMFLVVGIATAGVGAWFAAVSRHKPERIYIEPVSTAFSVASVGPSPASPSAAPPE
jgi:MFS family permease